MSLVVPCNWLYHANLQMLDASVSCKVGARYWTLVVLNKLFYRVGKQNSILCPGFTDSTILQGSLTISGLVTGLKVAVEIFTKIRTDTPHVGRSSHYIHLGAKAEELNQTAWLLLSMLAQISVLTVALGVYKILKYRSENS